MGSKAGIQKISLYLDNNPVHPITAYISEVSARMDSEKTEIVFTMLQMGNL